MPRRAQPVGRVGVADVAELGFGLGSWCVDDLRAQHLAAEARVDVRLLAPQPVVHVERRHAVAELGEHVPEACRVGPTRHEARDLAAGLDQPVPADVALD